MSSASDATLVADLRRAFRVLTAALLALLIVAAAGGAFMVAYVQPRVAQLAELTRELRVSHERTMEWRAALHDWLGGTDERDPRPVAEAAAAGTRRSAERMAGFAGLDNELGGLLSELLDARERWADGWAAPVGWAGPGQQQLQDAEAALFDAYRESHDAAISRATALRDRAFLLQRAAIVAEVTIGLLATAVLLWVTLRQRRRLEDAIVRPLGGLLATMARVRAGDLSARPEPSGPRELRDIATALDTMMDRLTAQQRDLQQQRATAERRAAVLRQVLVTARETAGSLDTAHVAATVATAARDLGGASAVRIWLTDPADDSRLLPAFDTDQPDRPAPASPLPLGGGLAGRAARELRALVGHEGMVTVRALPLVAGGGGVGVLELRGGADGGAVPEALEALAIHAAAALHSARLHQRTEELSTVDGLTGLLNRRRFDADLPVEYERSRRYHRPLGFVLADIDHFKRVNDRYGHQRGDEILRRVARTLRATVRGSDSVYRYGGEELAVIVRDSSVEAAAELAERLRAEIAGAFRGADGRSTITASFGVSGLPGQGRTPQQLVRAADRALYRAKRSGRNAVVVAEAAAAGRHGIGTGRHDPADCR